MGFEPKKRLRTIQPGELLLITSGAYSGYAVHCLGTAVRQVPLELLLEDWLNAHPEQREEHRFQHEEFLAHLTTEGFIEEVNHVEFHLSGYQTAAEVEISDVVSAEIEQYNYEMKVGLRCHWCGAVPVEITSLADREAGLLRLMCQGQGVSGDGCKERGKPWTIPDSTSRIAPTPT